MSLTLTGTLNANVLNTNTEDRKYGSMTSYTSSSFLATRPSGVSFQYWWEEVSNSAFTTSRFILVPSPDVRGMHYNSVTNKAIYVDALTGNLDTFDLALRPLGNLEHVPETVSTNGTYKTLIGDISNTYVFGWKVSSGGANQLFRADSDGVNEITVDTSTLFGSDVELGAFAFDSDNQLVYFADTSSTATVRSVSSDMSAASFATHNLVLRPNSNASNLSYARGFLYFGGTDPVTGLSNSKFYRYNPSNDEVYEIAGAPAVTMEGGDPDIPDMYIDPHTNSMIISATDTVAIEGTDFDFYGSFISVRSRFYDGIEIEWVPVAGATSYNVFVNDVLATTTTETIFSSRGHVPDTVLNFRVQSSTDDVTYTDALYRTLPSAIVKDFFIYGITQPFGRSNEGSGTIWLDPYNPVEMILGVNSTIHLYDPISKVLTQVATYLVSHYARNYQNKEIIGAHGVTIANLGAGLANVYANDNASFFANHTIYLHSTNIKGLDVSFDGTTIYFSAGTNEIWSVSIDGTNPQLLFSTTGESRSLSLDPHDPDTLVYVDGSDLMYRNLSTGITTTVLAGGFALNNGIDVIDGTIFTFKRFQGTGYTRVKLDGITDFVEGPRAWGFGFVTDTVNKVAYGHGITNSYDDLNVVIDGLIPDLPADPSIMALAPRPISIRATWSAVGGATSYGVGYSLGQPGVNAIISSIRRTTDFFHSVRNLQPDTEYTVYVYYSTGGAVPSIVVGARTVSTSPNTAGNYEKNDYGGEDGKFSFEDLDQASLDTLGEVMNDLFTTGDDIAFKLPTGKSVSTRFVRRGETTNISDASSVSLPFTANSGSGQTASLTLSDSTTVAITYDETTEEMSIEGQVYTSGQSFVVDGKKVTLYDV